MIYSDLQKTLAGLVGINSVNPAYVGGRPEADIQKYVQEFFSSHGLPTFEQPVLPERSNIIGRLPGRGGPPLIFEAHCDTAGVEGMDAPLRPEVRDGRMYGRGTCDTKAGLAAMMCALADVKKSGAAPAAEIWVVSAMDEEFSYRGVWKLKDGLKASGAVIAEPTRMRMVVASKGCLRARITVLGRAAHSSKPYLGVNAISGMVKVLQALELDGAELSAREHPLVGRPTLNVGMIEGGTQVNIVPASCSIAFDRRLIPGEDPDAVEAGYRRMLERLREESGVNAEMEELLRDWPLETAADSGIVRCAGKVLRNEGLDPEPCGVPFGSDASKLALVGIPAIILGPGSIDQAHAVDEYVELEQVEQAFEVYRKTMLEFEV